MESLVNKIVNKMSRETFFNKISSSCSKMMMPITSLSFYVLIGQFFINEEMLRSSVNGAVSLIIILIVYFYLVKLDNDLSILNTIISIASFSLILPLTLNHILILLLWSTLVYYIHSILNKLDFKINTGTPAVDSLISNLLNNIILILMITGFVWMCKNQQFKIIETFVFLESLIFSVLNFLPLYLFLSFMMLLLWYYGFHGDQLLGPLLDPMLVFLILINLSNFVNKIDSLSIINGSFHLIFSVGTGTGMTGGLILSSLLFNKEKNDKKEIKNLSKGMIFNINEPILFGYPVIMNPALKFQFLFAPLISILFGYSMIYFGVIEPFIYPIPWITPPLLKSFIASGGDLKSVFVEACSYLLSIIIYSSYVFNKNRKGN